ncbi:MAG: hypothetical protein ACE5R6_12260 [Candidatus Heimdallarchaeota archaeon]
MSISSLHERIWKNKVNRTIILSLGFTAFFVVLGFLLILWPRPEEGEPVPWFLNQIGLGDLTVIDILGIICFGFFFFFLTVGIAAIREVFRQVPGILDVIVSGLITFAIGGLLLSWWGGLLTIVLILIFTIYLGLSEPSE